MTNAPAKPREDLDLNHVRELLEGEQSRLREQLKKLDEQDELGGSAGEVGEIADYDQHPAAQGTELFFREQDLAIEESLQGELRQVEAAYHKLEKGAYGYCDRCGEPIPAERLEVLPYALFCLVVPTTWKPAGSQPSAAPTGLIARCAI